MAISWLLQRVGAPVFFQRNNVAIPKCYVMTSAKFADFCSRRPAGTARRNRDLFRVLVDRCCDLVGIETRWWGGDYLNDVAEPRSLISTVQLPAGVAIADAVRLQPKDPNATASILTYSPPDRREAIAILGWLHRNARTGLGIDFALIGHGDVSGRQIRMDTMSLRVVSGRNEPRAIVEINTNPRLPSAWLGDEVL